MKNSSKDGGKMKRIRLSTLRRLSISFISHYSRGKKSYKSIEMKAFSEFIFWLEKHLQDL